MNWMLFLFLIGILTYQENILIYLFSFIFIIILLNCIQFCRKKFTFHNILRQFGIFIYCFIIIWYKNYSYYQHIQELDTNYYLGTGIITDNLGINKYIFQDKYQRNFIFYSNKSLTAGDIIYVEANLKNTNLINKLSWHNYNLTGNKSNLKGNFDYNKRLFSKDYYGVLQEKKFFILNKIKLDIIGELRKYWKNSVLNIYGNIPETGVILGMTIGDLSYLDPNQYQDFITSSLVHILAVSGGNIIMLVIFLKYFLFFIPFYIRLGIILIFILFYCLICGLDSSVFRALVMGFLSLGALFWGKQINITNLLIFAMIILLTYNPYFLLYDLGFLLSFGAIIGIIYTNKISWQPENFVFKIGYEYFKSSCGAFLGVFPIIAFYVGQINLIGIIGNMLILPLLPLIMIWGIISVFIYSLWKINFIIIGEIRLLKYLLFISNFFATNGLFLNINNNGVKYVIVGIYFVIISISQVSSLLEKKNSIH